MGISVKLEVFEGPLDLLLHLIDKNKIDIYDIPIVEITEQYLEYVRDMEENLEVVSEFLLMAATLLDIKSRMLLPQEEGEEEGEDPRQELLEQLLQYKMYKLMSKELKSLESENQASFYRKESLPKEVKEFEEPVDMEKLMEGVSISGLYQVFQDVMKKRVDKMDPVRSRFGKIEKEEVTLPEKLSFVKEYTKKHKKVGFRQLLQKQKSKTHLVVTFLAVLQLMKEGEIEVMQKGMFEEIEILWKEGGRRDGNG